MERSDSRQAAPPEGEKGQKKVYDRFVFSVGHRLLIGGLIGGLKIHV